MSLKRLVEDLHTRLKKEIARTEGGTVQAGGYVMAGNACERLVGAAAELLYLSRGFCLRDELQRTRRPQGLGSYLAALGSYDTTKVADLNDRAIVRTLATEAAKGQVSRLKLFNEYVRIPTVHPGGDTARARTTMIELKTWIERAFSDILGA